MRQIFVITCLLLLLASFAFAQNPTINENVEIQGSGEVPSGGSKQFTDYFQIYFVANSMSVSKSGTDASKVDVTHDSWSQNTTTGYVATHITIGVHSDVAPGSVLHFTLQYNFNFSSGIGFYQVSWTITVTGTAGISADFEANPTSGTAPLIVQFTDKSTGTITNRTWDFGDGQNSTATNPSHTYQNAGTYTVKLTVTGTGGSNTKVKTNYITVYEESIITINEARKDNNNDFIPDLLNQDVQIKGIVTSPNFSPGTEYFIQDQTGGICFYSGSFTANLQLGDEVSVSGIVTQYRGKTEVVPHDISSVSIQSQGNQLPEPMLVNINEIGEDTEGILVKLRNVWIVNPSEWPSEGNEAAIEVTDGINTTKLFIDKDTDLDGWMPLSGNLNIIGISDQYTFSDPPNDGYQIRIRFQSDFADYTSIEKTDNLSYNYSLEQNYPNPFNSETKIEFVIPVKKTISLEIYDISGRLVNTLISNEEFDAGPHSIYWNGKNEKGQNVSTGVYFYRLRSGNFSVLKRMAYIR